jgi:hypothetical protein
MKIVWPSVLVSTLALGCPASDDGNADGTGDGTTATAGDDGGTPGDGEGTANPSGTAGDDDGATSTTGSDPDDTGSTGTPADTGDETGDPTGPPIDAEVWELRADGFDPPIEVETYYSCFSFNIPVDKLYHVVGFEPVVTQPVIHHYVLSYSPNPVNLDPLVPCIEWPAQILWAWAPGMGPMYLPEEAGFLVGQNGDTATFILQVHYNNPLLQDFVDNDGIDVLVTDELREHRAGVFSQGDIGSISIPGGEPAYEHVARCESGETESLLSEPINVFASFLHAHQLGSAITSELIRDGSPVGFIAQEVPFDFNSQKFLPADITVEPGDVIETRCTYDSTGVAGNTSGGVASDEEMCINFMMYWPWVDAETCGSI